MRRTRSLVRLVLGATVAATAVAGTTLATAGQAQAQSASSNASAATAAQASASTDLVMFAQGTDGSAAVAAAKSAGATVVKVDRQLGYAVVRSADPGAAGKLAAAKGIQGTACDRVIGQAPKDVKQGVERLTPAAGQQAAAVTPK